MRNLVQWNPSATNRDIQSRYLVWICTWKNISADGCMARGQLFNTSLKLLQLLLMIMMMMMMMKRMITTWRSRYVSNLWLVRSHALFPSTSCIHPRHLDCDLMLKTHTASVLNVMCCLRISLYAVIRAFSWIRFNFTTHAFMYINQPWKWNKDMSLHRAMPQGHMLCTVQGRGQDFRVKAKTHGRQHGWSGNLN